MGLLWLMRLMRAWSIVQYLSTYSAHSAAMVNAINEIMELSESILGEILGHLLKVIPAGFRISYRIYEKGLMKLVNRDFLFDLPEGYREHKRIRPEPPAYNTVVFLEKKGNCSRGPE